MGRNPIGKREGRNSWMRKGSVECKKWEGGKEKAIAMGFGFRPNLSLNAATSRINIYEELVGLLSLSCFSTSDFMEVSIQLSTSQVSQLNLLFFFFLPPFLPSFLFSFYSHINLFIIIIYEKCYFFFFLI